MCLNRTQRPTSSKEELHPVLKQDSVILFRILVLKFMQAYGNDSVTFPLQEKNVAGCLLVFIWPCDNKRKRIQRSRSRKCYIRFQRLCPFSVFNIVSQSKCSSFVLKPQRADINLDSLGGRMTSRLCCQGNRKCDQVLPLSLNFTFQCLGETKAED